MEQFVQRFKKRFNVDVQIYSPYAYDAVMAMATAMADAKSVDPAKYLPYLSKVKYQGISGLIAFDEFGDIKDGAMSLYTFKGGKKTLLEVVR
jgi:branched-chain amino acid transport system substrate-binding protein